MSTQTAGNYGRTRASVTKVILAAPRHDVAFRSRDVDILRRTPDSMKRTACLLLVALAFAVAPVHAFPGPTTGTIRIGVASPTPARTLYNSSAANNGLVGYVFALPAGSDNKRYTLTRVSGTTGTENLDAYFYSSLTSDTGSCDAAADITETETGPSESGTICPNPGQVGQYAIIVMKVGLNATFSFSVV